MPNLNTKLAELEVAEADNLRKSKLALGSLWVTAEPVPLLYGVLSQALWDREDVQDRPELYGLSAFLLAAQRAASVGILTIGRLHLQEAVHLERRCLELVGFSYRAWKDPAALTKWLHARRGASAYEEYQREFSGKKLRGDLKELKRTLPEAYDSSNRMIHASLYSLAQSYERATVEGGEELRIHMFDAQTDDHWPRVALALLRTTGLHLDAAGSLAARVLKGVAGRAARARWKRAHDPAVAGFRTERERWGVRITRYRNSLRRGLQAPS